MSSDKIPEDLRENITSIKNSIFILNDYALKCKEEYMDTKKENDELKERIETMQNEIEVLKK